MRIRLAHLAALIILSLPATFMMIYGQMSAETQVTPSHKSGAILVELFTSEGCSSCPPADALLRKIDGTRTESGQIIVGVSEHVTYWNQLGWSDPYSAQVYTERQNAYAERFHLDSVYTPQMIVNGQEQIVGSDSAALLHALRTTAEGTQVSVHINSATASSNALDVNLSVDGSIPSGGADVYAILADNSASSDVLHGENAGRTLVHTSVARTITHIGKIHAPVQRTIHVPLPNSALSPPGHARHLILFAQTTGYGPVLAVDTRTF